MSYYSYLRFEYRLGSGKKSAVVAMHMAQQSYCQGITNRKSVPQNTAGVVFSIDEMQKKESNRSDK